MTKEQLILLTVVELKVMAKENGLKGYSKLRKAELVELLATEAVETEIYVNGEKAKVINEGGTRNVFLENGVTFEYDFLVATLDENDNLVYLVSKAEIFVHGRSREFLEQFFEEYGTNDIYVVKENLVKRFNAIDKEKEELHNAQEVLSLYLEGKLVLEGHYDLIDNDFTENYTVGHEIEKTNSYIIFPALEKCKIMRTNFYKSENNENLAKIFNISLKKLKELYDYANPYELWYNGNKYSIKDKAVFINSTNN